MAMDFTALGRSAGKVDGGKTITTYDQFFDGDTLSKAKTEERQSHYAEVINKYYNLATDFYEYGWGTSFHFAPRGHSETFIESIRRHEHLIALNLNLRPNMTVLDMGAGIGGPMREMIRISGCTVIANNNNEYQINRARILAAREGRQIASRCRYVLGDFHNLPIEANSVDAAYAIEATCHSPDRRRVFGEALRVIKPGSKFITYEWVTTPEYDSSNPEHRRIISDLITGNSLPQPSSAEEVRRAMAEAGFVDIVVRDLAAETEPEDIPWYEPLSASFSLTGFRHTSLGRKTTSWLLWAGEKLRLVPQGTCATQVMLCKGADSLVEAGRLRIFTPMLYVEGTKPAAGAAAASGTSA